MKSKKRTIGILIVVIVILFGFACSLLIYRNKLSSESSDITNYSSVSPQRYFDDFYNKPITDEKIALEAIEANRYKLGYNDKDLSFEFKSKSEFLGTSYRFNILYKGIPLDSDEVNVLVDEDDKAKHLLSRELPIKQLQKINTTPKITQDEAIKIAKSTMNMKSDIKLKLVLYEVNDTYVLAYYYCGTTICIINAENGEVVACYSAIDYSIGEFTGQNGDIHQVFYDDYEYENNYIKNALWDKEKNIFIHDNIHTNEEVKNKARMITIDDLQSDKYKSAVDGMANTYRAVEYFEKHFNKKFNSTVVSINVDTWKDENDKVVTDNAGGGYLDIEGEKVAFLMFPFASDKKKPQYSAYLDLVAHEYTHAITNSEVFGSGYSTDSRYFERNALKEAYSDIFGELIEEEYTGQTDWKNSSIRNLAEKEENTQYRYKYSERYTGTKDNGGAHLNSTIISHTAYLMSKSNDSNKYDTEFLLDYNQLSQLWYGSLEHLNNKSDFSDCRYAIEVSAEDLIEKGVLVKNNLKVIQQAFEEVGVSSNPIRRGAKDSAEIIENYEWYLEPTIEADNIIVPDYDNELYEKYAIIEKNGKYGLISNKGKIEVECKYLGYSICSLENTYIMANKIDNNYISKSDDYKFENNKLVQSQHSSHDGDSIKYIYDKKENKAYIQDYGELREYTGNEVYPAQEGLSKNESGYYKYYDTLGKWGIISGNKVIKDFEYSNGRYTDNLIALEKNNIWGYFDSKGKEIIPFIAECSNYINCEKYISSTYTFDNMAFMDVDGIIAVNTKDGGCFYDINGDKLTDITDFEEVRPMINDFAWVKKDGKWGVIKYNSEEIENYEWHLEPTIEADNIIVPDYDNELYEKYAIIEKNGKYGLISNKGDFIEDIKYNNFLICPLNVYIVGNGDVGDFELDDKENIGYKIENEKLIKVNHPGHGIGDITYYYYNKDDNKTYVVPQVGDNYKEYKDDSVVLAQGVSMKIEEDGTYTFKSFYDEWYLVNSNGKINDNVYECGNNYLTSSCSNNIIYAKNNNEWYYFNNKGEQIIFDKIKLNYMESGRGHIIANRVNKNNVISCPFLDVDGVIAVNTKDGGCFYDINGNKLTDITDFEEVRPMINGFAWVKKDGKWGVIKYNREEVKEDENWKKEYINCIKKIVGNDTAICDESTFMFVNINGDDIPEIFYDSGFGYGGSALITYNNKNAIELHEGNSSYIYYIEGENLFDYSGGHMDSYYDKIYQIVDGEFVMIYDGVYGAVDNSRVEYNENGKPIYNYYWNNVQVSEEEYNDLLNKAFDRKKAICPFDANKAYSYKEIFEAIENYDISENGSNSNF